MPIIALEFFLVLCGVIVAVLVYRALIRSHLFASFLSGFQPPAESESDVVELYGKAQSTATRVLDDANQSVLKGRATARAVRRLVK